MAYAIFFRDEGKKLTMRLPQNPEQVNQSREQDIEEVSVLKLGKVALPKETGLLNIDFEVQLPHRVSSLVETPNDFKDGDYYRDKLEGWMKEGTPVRFICSNGLTKDLSILVLVKGVEVREVAGEEGDFYAKINLLEYKPYSKKEIRVEIVQKPPVRPPNPPQPPYNMYTIVSGDCLWNIAKRFLGDGARWPEIYNINRPPLGGNPNLIYPGQRIKIPG